MQYYVRNWWRFQHYKHRNPPWIKLHVEILSSEDFTTLDDASKLLAMVCMVVAAKHGGAVPANPEYIKRVAYLNKTPNFNPLLSCGFLVETLADASDCKQLRTNACTETETETETERKIERAAIGKESLPIDWRPNSTHLMLADQLGVDIELEAGKLRDWAAANGQLQANWNSRFTLWLKNSKKSHGGFNGKTTDARQGGLAAALGKLRNAIETEGSGAESHVDAAGLLPNGRGQ